MVRVKIATKSVKVCKRSRRLTEHLRLGHPEQDDRDKLEQDILFPGLTEPTQHRQYATTKEILFKNKTLFCFLFTDTGE